jgi:hypothetical protein
MNKLVFEDSKDVVTPKFLQDHGILSWGNFNTPPEPYEGCDASEFWRHVFSYGFGDYTEFRQVTIDDKSHQVHLVIYHDTIFMIDTFSEQSKISASFYRVGCKHHYKSENIGKCLHRLICEHCGYSQIIDSSD